MPLALNPDAPLEDRFVEFGVAAVAASFPFLSWLIPVRAFIGLAPFLRSHYQAMALWALTGGGALAASAAFLTSAAGGKRTPRAIADYFAKGFVLLYGLLPIVVAIFSLPHMAKNPCDNLQMTIPVMPAMTGCGVSVSPFYVRCAQIGTALLGLCVSGGLVWSAVATRKSPKRRQLFRWSLLAWLLIAAGAAVSWNKACAISCGTAPAGFN